MGALNVAQGIKRLPERLPKEKVSPCEVPIPYLAIAVIFFTWP